MLEGQEKNALISIGQLGYGWENKVLMTQYVINFLLVVKLTKLT